MTKAIGDWILFLDADDTLVPDALTIIAKDIFNIYDIDVFTYNLFVETNGKKSIRNKKHAQGVLCIPFINYFFDEIYPRTGNMVCRRQVLLKEPFDETIRRHEDTQNTFRLMRKYRFYASKDPIFSYNQDTLEACFRRNNYKEDFSCIMNPKGKSIFEQICMYNIYMKDVKVTYPDLYLKIYGTTFEKKRYKYLTYLFFKTKTLKARLLKILNKLAFGMKNYI